MQWLVELCVQPGGFWVAIILLTSVVGLCGVAIVGLVQWRLVKQSEQQAILMQEMLQRGMSADDIHQILMVYSGTGVKLPRPGRIRLPETTSRRG